MTARYVHVPSPGRMRAVLDADSGAAAAFYASLVAQTLRYGLPARRRGGRALALFARNAPARMPIARVLRRLPSRSRPDVDELLRSLDAHWPMLVERARELPREAPPLTALVLERSAGRTVFVFGADAHPLLVAKVPGKPELLEREAQALRDAGPADVGPRYLGEVGAAYVQEGLRGEPLRVAPVVPERAGEVAWSNREAELASALARLAAHTRRDEPIEELDALDAAVAAPLDARTRAVVEAAAREVRTMRVSVLRHGDTSAQNCFFDGERFTGLVDWELAKRNGAPGFDMWNAALAFVEHGVGLVRWSEERVLESFRAAWQRSPFFAAARAAARESASAAGVPEELHDALEVAFFARRLGRRVAEPSAYATGPRIAAEMLAIVCAS